MIKPSIPTLPTKLLKVRMRSFDFSRALLWFMVIMDFLLSGTLLFSLETRRGFYQKDQAAPSAVDWAVKPQADGVEGEVSGSKSTAPAVNGLYIMLSGPVELIVTDSIGRRTGVDARNGNEVLEEIPQSSYTVDAVPNLGKIVEVSPVTSGLYRIQVVNHDMHAAYSGDYTMEVYVAGELTHSRIKWDIKEAAAAGIDDQFEIKIMEHPCEAELHWATSQQDGESVCRIPVVERERRGCD